MTIDYSKWDNLDTDSERETPPPAALQSGAPATADPVTGSTPGSVQAITVRCDGERARFTPWSVTSVKADHPIFSNFVPPIPRLIEVPLVFHRVGSQSADRADLDNQVITYLHIDSESGFAPPSWQSHIGTVLVARKDQKTLRPQHLEGVWMYCDHILDLFGDGEGAPTHMYRRQAFEEWWKDYCKEQKKLRRGMGGENDPDDWRAVQSPYVT
ncbi:hypothetical protein Forpi1262_v009381 [Fusarium oxysporum f. sp. raphani]|uniref:Ectomycorrhiza-upregulated zf-mynd domain-containing protein n=1 Tax=Fusarium oxysporum f. sp. raphani TaxID=96318 RepID=A0A8J5PH50_FUSOX|nr:hypothetical protein Forpi1262_v017981 [Fusarium oxysporum f. sp. raphani]KAG7428185.1 hypothetical protein Forpi1262_v011018 [Fusarium oxysporum f. sp. raphani]KAG7429091.1 hypothetical protein Forpi1262_v009381 [Fusarium oxysporum f. sp. raphani]